MIAIACDHAGIDLKPHVIAVLDELGIPYDVTPGVSSFSGAAAPPSSSPP